MKRRELLKKSALAALGISLPTGILLSLESCAQDPKKAGSNYLGQQKLDTIWHIAEQVIPRTDTPGADDAAVAEFIDLLFEEYFDEVDRNRYEGELKAFMEGCMSAFGKPFAELDPEQQRAYLERMDQAKEGSFLRSIKPIILWAYFTSEPGMKAMNYLPVPGRFQGCITIDDQERILVGNR